jgi:hypothetical protein
MEALEMKKLIRFSQRGVFVGLIVFAAGCVTDDNRPPMDFYDINDKPGGLGDLCAEDTDCDTSRFSCYDGACTPTALVTACEAAPSCGKDDDGEALGYCIARQPGFCSDDTSAICFAAADCEAADATCNLTPIETSCNCFNGLVFDGTSCVSNPTPDIPEDDPDTATEEPDATPDPNPDTDDVVETCPAELLTPTLPNEDTGHCPTGSICTESACGSGGTCYVPYIDLDSSLGDNDVVLGGNAADTTQLSCTRVYQAFQNADGEWAERNEDGDWVVDDDDTLTNNSTGVRVTIAGALAGTLITGATQIVVELSKYPAEDGGLVRIWPDGDNPPLRDAGIVDVTVTGATFGGTGIAGDFSIDVVSGEDTLPVNGVVDKVFINSGVNIGGQEIVECKDNPDAPDDDKADGDGLIDGGLLGVSFAVYYAADEYITANLLAQCGDNEVNITVVETVVETVEE